MEETTLKLLGKSQKSALLEFSNILIVLSSRFLKTFDGSFDGSFSAFLAPDKDELATKHPRSTSLMRLRADAMHKFCDDAFLTQLNDSAQAASGQHPCG